MPASGGFGRNPWGGGQPQSYSGRGSGNDVFATAPSYQTSGRPGQIWNRHEGPWQGPQQNPSGRPGPVFDFPTGPKRITIGPDGFSQENFDPHGTIQEGMRSADRRYSEDQGTYRHGLDNATRQHLGRLDHAAKMGDIQAGREAERIRAQTARHATDTGFKETELRTASADYAADLQLRARQGDTAAELELGRLGDITSRRGQDIGAETSRYGIDQEQRAAQLRHELGLETVAAGREASRRSDLTQRYGMDAGQRRIESMFDMLGSGRFGDLFGAGGPTSSAPSGGGGGGGYRDTMGTGGPGLGEQQMMSQYASALQGGSLADIEQGRQRQMSAATGPGGGWAGRTQGAGDMDRYTAAMAGVANKDRAFNRQLQRGQLGASLLGAFGGFA